MTGGHTTATKNNDIWCASIRGHMIIGPIVGSDYYVLLYILWPPVIAVMCIKGYHAVVDYVRWRTA